MDMNKYRTPLLHIQRDLGGLDMIREKPLRGMCAVSRNRFIVIVAIVLFSWLFAMLYFKPLTKVSILQVDASFMSKDIDGLKVKDELRNIRFDTSSDENSSTGNDARTTVLSSNDLRFGSDPERSVERSTTSGIYPTVKSTYTTTLAGRCAKKRNVSFLKVHKAGSTTLMNIFLRFAIQNGLNIVLPARSTGFGFNYLGYGKTVTRDNIVPLPGSEIYNILCNHVVYNKTSFRSIMPVDTEYVGIIREPKSHFVSASSYYGFFRNLQQYAKDTNYSSNASILSTYLNNPSKFQVNSNYVHNRMSFDFGVPKTKFFDEQFLEKYINELNDDYTLIMVMERFPESLVMMKRALCWHTKDILYVPLNGRSNKQGMNLTDADVVNLKAWNGADFKLYDHFYEVFDELVAEAGPGFIEEVEQFKITQSQVETFCKPLAVGKNKMTGAMHFEATQWSPGFVVSIDDCLLMTESELPMMSRLIKGAWDRYNDWKVKQTTDSTDSTSTEENITDKMDTQSNLS